MIGIFERKGGFLGGDGNSYVALPITTFDVMYPGG